jgi:membrane protein DedA with SNARE-associated domain
MSSLPIIETLVWFITTAMGRLGYPGLVLLMAIESFGIPPLPSEVILPFAGFLVATGVFSWTGAILAAMVGGVAGSFVGYAVGRWGRHLVSGGGRFSLSEQHLASMDLWFRKWGQITVLLGRLVPLIRSYISYPAGTAKMDPAKFGVYTAIGALPFTVALLYAGFVLRSNWNAIVPTFGYLDDVAVAALVIVGIYLAWRWRTSSAPPAPVPATAVDPPEGGGGI